MNCRDSASGAPESPSIDGVSSTAFAGTHSRPEDMFSIKGADRRTYLLWKTFLNVAPTAAPYRTITVTRPSTARLYYADPQTWGSASDSERVAGASRRVRFPACGSTYAGYTGGIIVPGPSCVTLSISDSNGDILKEIIVPIATSGC